MQSVYFGERKICPENPCYIIAEIGVNHNGDIGLAHQLIDRARESGADAVKFQTFSTEALVRNNTKKAAYQETTTGGGSQNEMLKKLELTSENFTALKKHCDDSNIGFISTAFDQNSLSEIAKLDPVCFKWPSGEINNIAFLRQVAALQKPVLLSTGMASLAEVATAVETLQERSLQDIVILQCVSNYPARIEDQNLRTIPAMSSAFGVPAGFSDHTIGFSAALAARALGMSVLEKHFTLDCQLQGPDHKASIEPEEFALMTRTLRQVEAALGDGIKRSIAAEKNIKAVARKSLVFNRPLAEGHILKAGDLVAKRPNDGVSPDLLDLFVGRTLTCDVVPDQSLDLAHVK